VNTRLVLAALVSVAAVLAVPALMHFGVLTSNVAYVAAALAGLVGGSVASRMISVAQKRSRDELVSTVVNATYRARRNLRAA
jgi:hypothetical protein